MKIVIGQGEALIKITRKGRAKDMTGMGAVRDKAVDRGFLGDGMGGKKGLPHHLTLLPSLIISYPKKDDFW